MPQAGPAQRWRPRLTAAPLHPQPHTLTQLSAPLEASRRTGWPGALEATSEPFGAAGAQLTAVQPTGCAPSICAVQPAQGPVQKCEGHDQLAQQASPVRARL